MKKLQNQEIAALIAEIFQTFAITCRMFDLQFQDLKRLNATQTMWARELTALGLNTNDKIKYALKRTRRECPDYIPSIKQFVEWCEPAPEDLGFLPVRQAFNFAVPVSHLNWEDETLENKEKQLNPTLSKLSPGDYKAIKYTMLKVGLYTFRRLSPSEAFYEFNRYYPITCQEISSGRLSEIPRKVTQQVDLTPEELEQRRKVGEEYLKRIREKLGMAPTRSGCKKS